MKALTLISLIVSMLLLFLVIWTSYRDVHGMAQPVEAGVVKELRLEGTANNVNPQKTVEGEDLQ